MPSHTHKHEKTDDDNDDWCAVCRVKGELIMCDGCCLSFHSECVGYTDDAFLRADEDWFCWNCCKRLKIDFAADTRPVDPSRYPSVMFVAVDDNLEHYYKYNVVQKRKGRASQSGRIELTLQTGKDKTQDVVEMSFNVRDKRIWRGDIFRPGNGEYLGLMVPAGSAKLDDYPVPMIPQFHHSKEKGRPAVDIPPPPMYRRSLVEDCGRNDDSSSEDLPVDQHVREHVSPHAKKGGSMRESVSDMMLEAADILSSFNSKGGNSKTAARTEKKKTVKRTVNVTKGTTETKASKKKRPVAKGEIEDSEATRTLTNSREQSPSTPCSLDGNATDQIHATKETRMTDAALSLDKGDDVEVWINETKEGPGGWVPGKIVERSLVDNAGKGSPYFAFYTIDTLPVAPEEDRLDPDSMCREMRTIMQVRKPLGFPISGPDKSFAVTVRKPPLDHERRRVAKFVKGDKVEAVVCGRYAPGEVLRDTADNSRVCRIKFSNPATNEGHGKAGKSQPVESVRLISNPTEFFGMLRCGFATGEGDAADPEADDPIILG